MKIEDVRQAINRFKELVAPELRSKFNVSKPYYVVDCGDRKADWPKHYKDAWGCDANYGVYLIFDTSDDLVYVGKANVIGKRLYDYFRNDDDPAKCKMDDWFAKRNTASVCVVSLGDKQPPIHYLGPALEWFLIFELNPVGNTHHRTRRML